MSLYSSEKDHELYLEEQTPDEPYRATPAGVELSISVFTRSLFHR